MLHLSLVVVELVWKLVLVELDSRWVCRQESVGEVVEICNVMKDHEGLDGLIGHRTWVDVSAVMQHTLCRSIRHIGVLATSYTALSRWNKSAR